MGHAGDGVADDIAIDRDVGRTADEDRGASGDACVVDSEAPDDHAGGRYRHRGGRPATEERCHLAAGSRHESQIVLVEDDRTGVAAGGNEDRVAGGRRIDGSLNRGKAVSHANEERRRAVSSEADDLHAREDAHARRDDARQARDRDGRTADRDRVVSLAPRQSDRVGPRPTFNRVRSAAELERIGSVGPLEGIDRSATVERVGTGIPDNRVPEGTAEHPLKAPRRRRLAGGLDGRRKPE